MKIILLIKKVLPGTDLTQDIYIQKHEELTEEQVQRLITLVQEF